MAFTNTETKEINCKVLLFANHSAGRRETIHALKRVANKEFSSESFQDIKSAFTPFEFVPITVGLIRDYNIKLHIYSLTIDDNYDSTLSILLKGADIISFSIDGDPSSLAENINMRRDIDDLLKRHQMNLNAIPTVYIYNYRNLNSKVPIELLRREFNPEGDLEIELNDSNDKFDEVLEKYSQLALDQLLRSI